MLSWIREFLSFQRRKIVAWTVMRFNVLDRFGDLDNNQEIRVDQSAKVQGCCPSRGKTESHTSSEKGQCKRRWSRVSISELQRGHSGAICIPQLKRRDLTGNLLRFATQKVKACLGTEYLNQTALYQFFFSAEGLRWCQVSFVEKLDEERFPASQEYLSSPWRWEGGWVAWRWFLSMIMLWLRDLRDGSLQPLSWLASETVSSIEIPRVEGPLLPIKSIRGPKGDQLSYQKLAERPSPTLQVMSGFANCLREIMDFHIQLELFCASVDQKFDLFRYIYVII